MQAKSFFIIEKIKKYRKCPALNWMATAQRRVFIKDFASVGIPLIPTNENRARDYKNFSSL